MTIVKTTISLTDQDRRWMDGLVESGEYVSNSEYVRNLIRQDRTQRRENPAEIEAIRAQLIKAEQGGLTDLNRNEVLAGIKQRARADGAL
ncbi:MAG: type II toxin-antitoxin system ParD family antitoxin [Halieaceae bacterium]|nr:type II toxin-antitoxin system ParD family antitoxin [Halieaceae bacterium]